MEHVAIMRKSWGLLPKIAQGRKTIESRWLRNRSAPWDTVAAGDVVYFKNSGGPVTLMARVAAVKQLSGLTPERIAAILREYGGADGLEPDELPDYEALFCAKRYCVLIFLQDIAPVGPFNIDKRGFGAMAAWLSVPAVRDIVTDRI